MSLVYEVRDEIANLLVEKYPQLNIGMNCNHITLEDEKTRKTVVEIVVMKGGEE